MEQKTETRYAIATSRASADRRSAIENGHAGYYVIIHYSMDEMELFGPFSTKEEADEELEYILTK